jgi:glycyl-tRNA synthetase beta chain
VTTNSFLFELGCEELPPRALKSLAQALAQHVEAQLVAAELTFGELKYYATPRRLAIHIRELATAQPEQHIKKLGPYLKQALEASGQASAAGAGFARSCGVSFEDLGREVGDKGERIVYATTTPGQTVYALMPGIMQRALAQLPIPKLMRWGDGVHAFVRPVHWLLMLFGTEVVRANLFAIDADRVSYGHRFHAPLPLTIKHADDYVAQLKEAYVIVSQQDREALIRQQLLQLMRQNKAEESIDDALLEEVSALVEWPVTLLCQFDEAFLQVPKEAIIAALSQHQKCFHLQTASALLAKFITVANIDSETPALVQRGNERVVRARLADADFFYRTDCQQPLQARAPKLAHVTYQKQLGSLWDKTERLTALSGWIAEALKADAVAARRAAHLAKCDLLTLMVAEFPELQGCMGQYYALHSGETQAVAQAVGEHYHPRFAHDRVPSSVLGSVLALADRLDKLVGCFGVNAIPTGDKDPFALRRAALGVPRIVIENKLTIDLKACLVLAQQQYTVVLPNADVVLQVQDFILERMKAWYQEQGISHDIFAAVTARQNNDLLDMHARIIAVNAFRGIEAAQALAAANKRVSRLLDKATSTPILSVQADLFELAAERQLAQALQDKQNALQPLLKQRDYTQALQALAALRAPLDSFFDTVMVMVDEQALRDNRLALLRQVRSLFLEVADISLLQ